LRTHPELSKTLQPFAMLSLARAKDTTGPRIFPLKADDADGASLIRNEIFDGRRQRNVRSIDQQVLNRGSEMFLTDELATPVIPRNSGIVPNQGGACTPKPDHFCLHAFP
jgi:hypothetical protein